MYEQIIRVDHAGEFGANMIYRGQLDVLKNTPEGPLIQHMWDQEKEHFRKFQNELIPKYNVRATALLPLWRIAGYSLGYGTALMGKNAAMACTTSRFVENFDKSFFFLILTFYKNFLNHFALQSKQQLLIIITNNYEIY